ncbi:Uncharacterised protein [Proteus mirabilis]|nr:Uncharacterised protein [Proteus mirabilis]
MYGDTPTIVFPSLSVGGESLNVIPSIFLIFAIATVSLLTLLNNNPVSGVANKLPEALIELVV